MKSLPLLCLICFCATIYAENILFVAMSDSDSHRRSLYPLAEALAKNGHSVTFFCEVGREDGAKGKNITNHHVRLDVDPKAYEHAEAFMNQMMWKKKNQLPLDIFFPWRLGTQMTARLLKEKPEEFKHIIDQHWDLLVIDALFTTTGIAFASLVKAPYVVYDPSTVTTAESLSRSIPFPAATFPPMFVSSTVFDHKLFLERIQQGGSAILDMLAFKVVDSFLYRPTVADVAPDASISNFYQNPQGSFVDYPTELDYPRPATRDLFFVGGKCKSATILTDKEMLDFVEDPQSLGTIVVAFGHMVKFSAASKEIKINFAKALNKLTQYRIVWQYKEEAPIPLGAHIKQMSWLPQTELMNHHKTKLFISHGGLKSITEVICGEVPAIVIPFFAEQIRNAFLFAKSGSGETMSKFNLTEENILYTAKKILNDPKYKSSVVEFKRYITDKPISPTDNGIFWAEYIIRHKGLPVKWYKSAAIKMSWFTYFMVDVAIAVALAILVPLVCVIVTVKKLLFKK